MHAYTVKTEQNCPPKLQNFEKLLILLVKVTFPGDAARPGTAGLATLDGKIDAVNGRVAALNSKIESKFEQLDRKLDRLLAGKA